jgi:hypothetical protein
VRSDGGGGTGIIGGMIGASTLALLFVPLFFYLFDKLARRGRPEPGGAHDAGAHGAHGATDGATGSAADPHGHVPAPGKEG